MKALRHALVSCICFGAGLAAGNARAQSQAPPGVAAPVSRTGTYSPFEKEAIDEALAALGTKVDPNPEGKIIERIDVLPREVIHERFGKIIGLLNYLHATTRPYVIDREILLGVGDRWQDVIVDETARNLRHLPQLSLVVVLPIVGSSPDKVQLLAITQDIWSLRLNSSFAYGPGGLESLLLQPTESNLAGTQQTAYGRFTLLPNSYSLGGGYVVPRLAGERLTFSADANVILNRQSGNPEGSFGSIGISRPLFSTLTEWSWGVTTVWRDEVIRRYSNAQLTTFDVRLTPHDLPYAERGRFTEVEHIPYEYRGRRITETAAVTRSYGWATKNDFTGGIELNNRLFHTGDLPGFDPRAVRDFVTTVVPVSDKRAGPFVQYRGYKTDFVRVLDFESLGLQEDYRLGHDLMMRIYPVTTVVGSSRNFLGIYGAAYYTIPWSDGLARAGVESSTEFQTDQISDASWAASARIITPRLGFGRFVVDGTALNRYRNYLNRLSYLGGDTRLRGYPSTFFVGKDVIAINTEFRSRPIEILTAQLGAAVFYDIGNAFDGFDNITLHHSWGLGARVLIPQLDKVVLRGDIGFPIPIGGGLPAGVAPVSFFIAFEQAFPVPGISGGPGTGLLGQ